MLVDLNRVTGLDRIEEDGDELRARRARRGSAFSSGTRACAQLCPLLAERCAVDRSRRDPQPGHGRRQHRPRRSGGRAPGRRDGARRDESRSSASGGVEDVRAGRTSSSCRSRRASQPDELIVELRVPAVADAHRSCVARAGRAPRRLRARRGRRRRDARRRRRRSPRRASAAPASGQCRSTHGTAANLLPGQRRRRSYLPRPPRRRRRRAIRPLTSTRPRRTGAGSCECSPNGRSQRRSQRRRTRMATRRVVRIEVNGVPRARGRSATNARRLPARRPGPDRHAPRLRARRLRRLHGSAGRGKRSLVHPLRGSGGGCRARRPSRRSLPARTSCTPLQEAFRERHGLQCGFCTPGFLMTAYELLRETRSPSDDEIRDDDLRKPLPLHRLPRHRRGDPPRRRALATVAGQMS